jgi:hypothetical protein
LLRRYAARLCVCLISDNGERPPGMPEGSTQPGVVGEERKMVDNPKHPTIASPCLCARLALEPGPADGEQPLFNGSSRTTYSRYTKYATHVLARILALSDRRSDRSATVNDESSVTLARAGPSIEGGCYVERALFD